MARRVQDLAVGRRPRTTAATRSASGETRPTAPTCASGSPALPGFGEMKVKALGAVLVEALRRRRRRGARPRPPDPRRRRLARRRSRTTRRRSGRTRRRCAPAASRPAPIRRRESAPPLAVVLVALACAGGSAYALRVPARAALHGLPEDEPVEQARRQAAGRGQLGRDHRLDRRLATGLHADFGSGPLGRLADRDPVRRRHARRRRASKVRFEYADESDRVGYPIPKRVHIEGGSDHHALLLDRDACRLYELGGLEKQGGRWHAWAGATWSLRSNRVRPAGWTSADAAGLPIFPGPRPLGRGEARRDRPRAPLHRPAHAARLRLPRAPLRELADRPEPAADGPARAAEGELRHPAASRARRGSC